VKQLNADPERAIVERWRANIARIEIPCDSPFSRPRLSLQLGKRLYAATVPPGERYRLPIEKMHPPARRRQTSPRVRVQPGDIPASAAARRMGLNDDAFRTALPNLIARGFPKPDPDTGNFDLDAIDAWRRSRHSHLFAAGRAEMGAMDASTVVKDRLAAASRGAR
jgi:hypothetical protein